MCSSSARARRRHAHRNPQPQRVEVTVERVGLARRTPAARGAGGLHEVLALGQRVAGTGRRQVEWQDHRQLLARDRHRPAALAVDDRDRRAPGALPGDREVVCPIAHRLARSGHGGVSWRRRARGGIREGVLSACGRSGRAGIRGPNSRSAITASVRSRSGMPKHGGGAEAPVHHRGDDHRQWIAAGGGGSVRPVSTSGIVSRLARAPLQTHPSAAPPGARATPRRRAHSLDLRVLR